jgi:hypothetical protein
MRQRSEKRLTAMHRPKPVARSDVGEVAGRQITISGQPVLDTKTGFKCEPQ